MESSRKVSPFPFYKLVASNVDLDSTFKSAVDAFNARDVNTIINLCDDNVVLVAVKRQDHYSGKAAVRAYLQNQFDVNKPTFTPTTINTTINPNGTVGHIIGTADWTDYDPNDPHGAQIDGSIRYAFNFVNRGNGWRISTLWGSADHLIHHP
jgi:ketosteroid isomerase-like protein